MKQAYKYKGKFYYINITQQKSKKQLTESFRIVVNTPTYFDFVDVSSLDSIEDRAEAVAKAVDEFIENISYVFEKE